VTKSEAQKQVRLFCRQQGIGLNASQGIPLMAKGDWLYCADDWFEALKILVDLRNARIDDLQPYPWEAK
jgi:hypothetical protein